ncbi:MAG: bifunctional homocysteine S-methyltransferase/methylenetetrahydrofolate reductase [Planctomycetes bacterium]|nr:bifunctional homocysteine S-methyltransferase/methylenetetrahydrofolate reductase [Planctomycetota bacterium]
MAREPFLDALKHRVLVGDGAYGTLFARRGLLAAGHIGPVLNLLKPGFVQAAHAEYIAAGTEVVETNTFGADRLTLAAADITATPTEICRAGARLAREAAGDNLWVLGTIAPISRAAGKLSEQERAETIIEQAQGLVEGGVDALLLETYSDLDDLLLAVQALTSRYPHMPVVAQMAFTLAGTTTTGISPEKMVASLEKTAVAVIGANCGGGETAAIEVLKRLVVLTTKPISIYPNRGLADFDDLGRPVYIESGDYFARSARRLADLGANLIGGCCGTTPDDIRRLKGLAGGRRPSMRHGLVRAEPKAAPAAGGAPTFPLQRTMEQDLRQGRVVIAEVDPPRGVDATHEVAGSRTLVEAGVDAITIADNPLSVMRMSNLALASILTRELNVRIVLHVACRDRSLIGTQSHLLGAYAMGITNILAVTGDPVATQAYKGSSGVFDMASHKLIEMISSFNKGEFTAGRGENFRTAFFVGGAFNCASLKLENEVKRFERKMIAGARFIMTQPVFDLDTAKRVSDACASLNLPLILGVMPLVSERNAEFLHHEVPGIDVPESVRARMAGKSGKAGREEGLAIAREMMQQIAPHVQGYYLITPMGRYEMIADLTRFAKSLAPARA